MLPVENSATLYSDLLCPPALLLLLSSSPPRSADRCRVLHSLPPSSPLPVCLCVSFVCSLPVRSGARRNVMAHRCPSVTSSPSFASSSGRVPARMIADSVADSAATVPSYRAREQSSADLAGDCARH